VKGREGEEEGRAEEGKERGRRDEGEGNEGERMKGKGMGNTPSINTCVRPWRYMRISWAI